MNSLLFKTLIISSIIGLISCDKQAEIYDLSYNQMESKMKPFLGDWLLVSKSTDGVEHDSIPHYFFHIEEDANTQDSIVTGHYQYEDPNVNNILHFKLYDNGQVSFESYLSFTCYYDFLDNHLLQLNDGLPNDPNIPVVIGTWEKQQ